MRPQKILSKITPKDLGLEFEEVQFKNNKGHSLHGWFIPRQKSPVSDIAKTIILLHGYPADKGDILPGLAFLNTKYNLFLFDFRYLGQSEGSYSTVGLKETDDLLAAIQYLKTHNITEVGVYGFSMGGAVALMTIPKAPEIKAVISEASYSSLDKMASELYRIPGLKRPLSWFTYTAAKLIGIDARKASPEESVKNSTIPILIIHSPRDNVIPFSHAMDIKEALRGNPSAEFWFSESYRHGVHSTEFQELTEEFFLGNL